MPFKTFLNWLFDYNKDSPLPKAKLSDEGKVLIPDILAYNSPITPTYLISIFQKSPKFNNYLNTYFNNINLWYLEKEDLLRFIKRCVVELRFQRKDIIYIGFRRQIKMFEILRDKIPNLKNDEILFLCELIDRSKEKDVIYETLGLEKPKRQKAIKNIVEKQKISLNDFLNEHFSTIKLK